MPVEHCEQLKYGCISCRSGCEDRLKLEMKDKYQGMDVIFPKKKRIRRIGGAAFEEETGLFPGYIFFSTREETLNLREILQKDYVYRLLTDPDGEWPLKDSDRAFAEMLFAEDGLIGFSRAFYESDKIRIVDGFLKNYEGNIIRVNKRARTAEVAVQLRGKNITMWLGFELLQTQEDDKNLPCGGK